jgi:hypothetical protein
MIKDKSISWKQSICIVLVLHILVITGVKLYSNHRKEIAKNLKEAREHTYNKESKSDWHPQPKTRIVAYPVIKKITNNTQISKKEILVGDVVNNLFNFLKTQVDSFKIPQNEISLPKKVVRSKPPSRPIQPKRTITVNKPSPTPIPIKRAIAVNKSSSTPIPVKKAVVVGPSYYPDVYPPVPRIVGPTIGEIYNQIEIEQEINNIINSMSTF